MANCVDNYKYILNVNFSDNLFGVKQTWEYGSSSTIVNTIVLTRKFVHQHDQGELQIILFYDLF